MAPLLRDRLLDRLEDYGDLPRGEVARMKEIIVAAAYLSRNDRRGGVVAPGQKYLLQDGRPFGWEQVPMSRIFKSVEDRIKNHVATEKQFQAYHRIFRGTQHYEYKRNPDWHIPFSNPHAEPVTEFSVSRAEIAKSNEQLIHDLVVAAEIPSEEASIRASIIFGDASAGARGCCMLTAGTWEVTGGRLGRDHTLNDVPNNHVRDRVMDYTTHHTPKDKCDEIRRAVFSDLTEAEIKKYARLVDIDNQRKHEEERQEREKFQYFGRDDIFSCLGRADQIKVHRVVGSPHTINATGYDGVIKQAKALDDIDDSIDLTPHPFCDRSRTRYGSRDNSVLAPDQFQLPVELMIGVSPADEVDRDCDQIRAMIKQFVVKGDWSLDEFRLSLPGSPARHLLTKFLERRGPHEGKKTGLFQSCWEFFHRREQLGLSTVGSVWQEIQLVEKKWGYVDPDDGESDDKENEEPKAKRVKTES